MLDDVYLICLHEGGEELGRRDAYLGSFGVLRATPALRRTEERCLILEGQPFCIHRVVHVGHAPALGGPNSDFREFGRQASSLGSAQVGRRHADNGEGVWGVPHVYRARAGASPSAVESAFAAVLPLEAEMEVRASGLE